MAKTTKQAATRQKRKERAMKSKAAKRAYFSRAGGGSDYSNAAKLPRTVRRAAATISKAPTIKARTYEMRG